MVTDLNIELELITDWTISNRLSINVNKTELMITSNRQSNHTTSDIKLDDHFLNYNNECKFLGVKIDHNFTFENHIKFITSKIAKNSGIFYKIRHNLSKQARLNYYYGLIFPYISQNVVVWGAACDSHMYPLITQQKRMIRLMTDAGRTDHTTPLFYQLEILKVVDIYKYFLSEYMFFKMKDGNFKPDHEYFTRTRNMAQTQRSITFADPKAWNSLPQEIRSIPLHSMFKRKVRCHLISQYKE